MRWRRSADATLRPWPVRWSGSPGASWLRRTTTPRSPERGQYRFVQALLREVAYQSLARPDRRTRHLAAARYLEALGEDELAGVLANHYIDTFHASRPGPEASAVAAQARIAALAAAERAISLHSHRQALTYLRQALSVTDAPADQAAIHERITWAAEFAGELELLREHGPRAVEMYRQLGDEAAALRAATLLGTNLIGYHLEDEAVKVLQESIERARPLGEIPELAGAWGQLARANMMEDRHSEAVAAADRALAIGDNAPPVEVVEALITKGTSLMAMSRLVESDALLRGAIDLADRYELVLASLRARNNLAGSLEFRDLAESTRLYREGYGLATRFGHRPFLYQFLSVMAENSVRAGKPEEWMPEIEAVEENERLPPYSETSFLGTRALRQDLAGDYIGADASLERIRELLGELQSVQVEAALELFRTRHFVLSGDWDDAIAHGLVAAENSNFANEGWSLVGLAAAAGDQPDVLERATAALESRRVGVTVDAMAGILRGAASARAGSWEEARQAFTRSLAELERAGELLFKGLAELLWDALAGAQGPEAAEAGRSATDFFGEIGATAMAERFRAAVVSAGAPAGNGTPAPARGARVRSGAKTVR